MTENELLYVLALQNVIKIGDVTAKNDELVLDIRSLYVKTIYY